MFSYEAHVEGDNRLRGDLVLAEATAGRRIHAILDDLGHFAHNSMLLYAGGRSRLVQKIGRDGVSVDPRTGELRDQVGARGPSPWPLYHHGGTGLHRRWNPDWIEPLEDREPATVIATRRARVMQRGRGATMKFFSRGRWWYRRRVAGQEPNPFVERAADNTELYLRQNIRNFAARAVGGTNTR